MFQDKVISGIIKKAIALSLIIIGILAIFLKEPKPYILGMIFGSSINILSFILMGKTTEKAVLMKPSKAYSYTLGNYFIRYAIYFVVLFVAAKANYINFLTTVLGFFIIKIVILSSAIYESIKEAIKKKESR